MATDNDYSTGLYAIIGFCVLLFLFQLIIIWYMWWIYGQYTENYNNMNDMIIDMYNLEVVEATTAGRDVKLNIPKRSLDIYLKRHKTTCNNTTTN